MNITSITKDRAQHLVEKWSPIIDFTSDKMPAITK